MKLIMTTGIIYTGGGIYTVWGVAEDKDGTPLFFDTSVDGMGFDPVTFFSKYPYETENTDCFPSYVPVRDSESYVVDCYAPDIDAHHDFWLQIFNFCKNTGADGDCFVDDLMERLNSKEED